MKFKKINTSGYIYRIILIIILCLIAASTIYPIFFTLNASIKTQQDWSESEIKITTNPTFENYVETWDRGSIPRTIFNSIVSTLGGVIGALLICSLAAYAATKTKFRGRNIFFIFIITSMMIPVQTILYPFFKVINDFKLVDRYIGLIFTFIAFGIPLTTYQLASYFKRIPNSLIESAKIDGASVLQVIFYIIMPIARPTLFTVGLINFVWMWNELLLPLLIMQNPKMQTLIVSLALMKGQYGVFPTLISAGVIVGILPVTLIYFFTQRHIIQGMTIGAVKG